MYAHQQAISCYQRALELTPEGSDRAVLYEKLGEQHLAAGDLDRALEHYGQWLDGCQESEKRAAIHWRMGNICEMAQHRAEALQHFEQALRELPAEGNPVERAQVMIDLAYLCIAHFNDFGQAEHLNRQSAALLTAAPRHPGWLSLYHNLGVEHGLQGRRAEVMELARKHLQLAEELGDLREVVLACLDLSYEYSELGEGFSDEVSRWSRRAIDTARRIGDLRLAAEALARQGMWLLSQPQQGEAAEAALQESRELCVRMGYPHPLAMVLEALVRHYLQSERAQEAKELGMAGVERLLDLGIEGIYLVRCFTRVLGGLQRACAQLRQEEAYAAFCRRMRDERAADLEGIQPRQWLLEPVEPALAPPWQVVEEEQWEQGSCPPSWSWVVDSRDPSQYQPVFSPAGLQIRADRYPRQVIQDYERNCDPPRLMRELAGDWTASVQIAVALETTGAERGLVLLAEGGRLQIAAARDRQGNPVENTAQISQQIAAGVVEQGLPVLALAELGATIGRDLLSECLGAGVGGVVQGESLNQALARIKREMIEAALRQCGGSRSRAAEQLGLSRSNLQMMMKRLGIR